MPKALLDLLARVGQLDFSRAPKPDELQSLAQAVPTEYALFLAIAGVLVCLFGGRPIVFRFVMAPIAAAVGWVLAPRVAHLAEIAPQTASQIAAGLLAVAAAFWPPSVVFLALGAVGAWVGLEVVGDKDYRLGVVPGFLLGGIAGLFASRFLEVAISALVGGFLVVTGAVALLAPTSFGPTAVSSPLILLEVIIGIAVVAMGFQFKYPAPSKEQREHARSKRLHAKQMKAGAKARAKRESSGEGEPGEG